MIDASTWIRPRWMCWLARLLGERIEAHDSGFTMVSYQWRGKVWLWDFIPPERSDTP